MLCTCHVFEPVRGAFPAVASKVPKLRKRGIQLELGKVQVIEIPTQVIQSVTDVDQTGNLLVLLVCFRRSVPHNRAASRKDENVIWTSAVLRSALFDVTNELQRLRQ